MIHFIQEGLSGPAFPCTTLVMARQERTEEGNKEKGKLELQFLSHFLNRNGGDGEEEEEAQ